MGGQFYKFAQAESRLVALKKYASPYMQTAKNRVQPSPAGRGRLMLLLGNPFAADPVLAVPLRPANSVSCPLGRVCESEDAQMV